MATSDDNIRTVLAAFDALFNKRDYKSHARSTGQIDRQTADIKTSVEASTLQPHGSRQLGERKSRQKTVKGPHSQI